jgi:uncharacterized 2Fe-2S/4Fe-4S cluster protein (DUF4445 family)
MTHRKDGYAAYVSDLMYTLEIQQEGSVHTIQCDGQDTMLQSLRSAGFEVYAPCGGNGTCGKCKVWIKGEGFVSSCVFPVDRDCTVVLPDARESQILVAQHKYTVKLPFDPGPVAMLASYPHGVAIDVGTTSLVFYLVNLITGAIVETRAVDNPQAAYGADVISRIQYVAGHKGGLQELQKVLIKAIHRQINHFVELIGISENEIVKISIAGNTTMLHILLGTDPTPIALAPFTPHFTGAQKVASGVLGLNVHEKAHIETLPCVSAYVGADIVAGLASINPSEKYRRYLFMDIGTNGELALVTPDRVLCCSTAAGPAFEGAGIAHGMTAREGAISEYDGASYQVIGNVPAAGICGSGLIDVVAWLVTQGLVQADGLLHNDFEVAPRQHTSIDAPIMISQQDIREVQLAKAAIAAGVRILMDKAGLSPADIDAVFLAGGFGNYIDTRSAMKIGLLSPEYDGRIIPLGNTSGAGALLALRSSGFGEVLETLLSKTEYIELSEEGDFAMEFAMQMTFEQPTME